MTVGAALRGRPMDRLHAGGGGHGVPPLQRPKVAFRKVTGMFKSLLSVACLLSFCFNLGLAQQRTGSLHGQVSDELGALIVGATVTLVATDGTQKTAVTNNEGSYNFNSVPPGPYTIHVTAPGFGLYEK